MNIDFTAHGWEDFSYWLDTDNDTAIKIKELITSIKQHPFKGLGKHGLKGFWSRRITREHRLVYSVSGKKGIDHKCTVIQCRFHVLLSVFTCWSHGTSIIISLCDLSLVMDVSL